MTGGAAGDRVVDRRGAKRARRLAKDAYINVRVAVSEKDKLIAYAEARGLTVSSLMRTAAIAAVVADGEW